MLLGYLAVPWRTDSPPREQTAVTMAGAFVSTFASRPVLPPTNHSEHEKNRGNIFLCYFKLSIITWNFGAFSKLPRIAIPWSSLKMHATGNSYRKCQRRGLRQLLKRLKTGLLRINNSCSLLQPSVCVPMVQRCRRRRGSSLWAIEFKRNFRECCDKCPRLRVEVRTPFELFYYYSASRLLSHRITP